MNKLLLILSLAVIPTALAAMGNTYFYQEEMIGGDQVEVSGNGLYLMGIPLHISTLETNARIPLLAAQISACNAARKAAARGKSA